MKAKQSEQKQKDSQLSTDKTELSEAHNKSKTEEPASVTIKPDLALPSPTLPPSPNLPPLSKSKASPSTDPCHPPDSTGIDRSLRISTEGKSSNDDISDEGKVNAFKFKSEAPIRRLLKYDTNSSAINLLSPSTAQFNRKGKRKASANQDGASIVSANLSSEMGTACFQGSARRVSAATSYNDSPEMYKDIEMAREIHNDPMSYISAYTITVPVMTSEL